MQFNTAGIYNVSLIVTTATGCSDTTQQAITIFPNPIAAFATTNACTNSNIGIANTSTIPSGSIQN